MILTLSFMSIDLLHQNHLGESLLGELKSELRSSEHLIEFCLADPKNYSYNTNTSNGV